MRAVALACAVAVVLALAPVAAASGPLDCAVAHVDDQCEVWVSSFRGGGSASAGGLVATRPVAVSPDGRRVFVVGLSDNVPGGGRDFGAVTVASDADDGRRLWTARHDGPEAGSDDRGVAVVTSSSGDVVYTLVSSFTPDGCTGALIAYEAATGLERWRWEGSCHRSLDVAPDGSSVYAVGSHDGQMAVTAIAAREQPGTVQWLAVAPLQPDHEAASAAVVQVSPDGDVVYLGGAQYRGRRAVDMTVAAVRTGVTEPARAGQVAWVAHDAVTDAANFYTPSGVVGLAVSPDGKRVFVTGSDNLLQRFTDGGMLTYAHDTTDGQVVWKSRHSPAEPLKAFYHVGPGNLAVSPDGQRLFVTGLASRPLWDGAQRQGPATVAYATADGRELWAVESSLPGQVPYYLGTYALQALSADGETVYASSVAPNPGPQWQTIAYDAGSGERNWTARWGTGPSYPRAIAASPTGGVFVAGDGKPIQNCVSILYCAPTPIPNAAELVTVRYD